MDDNAFRLKAKQILRLTGSYEVEGAFPDPGHHFASNGNRKFRDRPPRKAITVVVCIVHGDPAGTLLII